MSSRDWGAFVGCLRGRSRSVTQACCSKGGWRSARTSCAARAGEWKRLGQSRCGGQTGGLGAGSGARRFKKESGWWLDFSWRQQAQKNEKGAQGELAKHPNSECGRTAGNGKAGVIQARKPAEAPVQRATLQPMPLLNASGGRGDGGAGTGGRLRAHTA